MLVATARAFGGNTRGTESSQKKMKMTKAGDASTAATGNEKEESMWTFATWRPVAAVAAAAVTFAVVSSSLGADALADLLRVTDAPEQLMSDFNVEFVVSSAHTPFRPSQTSASPDFRPIMMMCENTKG